MNGMDIDIPLQKGLQKRRVWTNPFTIFFSTIAVFVVSQVIGALLLVPFLSIVPNQNEQMFVYAAGVLSALICVLIVGARVVGFSRSSIGLVWPPLRRLLEVVPVFIAYAVISMILTLVAIQVVPGFDVGQAQDVGFKDVEGIWPLVMAGVALVVLTPIYEEVIFRGILFRGLRIRLPFLVSAGVSSFVFALAHGQWNVAVDTFALGIALSFLTERSGSVLPAILLHMLKNGIAFTLLFLLKV